MTPRKKQHAGKEAAAVVRAANARRKMERAAKVITAGGLTFRAFLSSPDYFPEQCADYSASMWAVVDALDGRPDLIPPDLCRELFNCDPADMPTQPQRVFGFSGGRRAGKTSRIAARRAIYLGWTLPAPGVSKGDVLRVAVIAPDRDAAMQCITMIREVIHGSPVLRAAVVSDAPIEEESDPSDIGNTMGVVLRRPDGFRVEFVIRAAAKGGATLRSRALLCVVMDEACFLASNDGHIVNDEDIFAAAEGSIRFIPGAQIIVCSTPWIDGEGLLERLIAENWASGRQGTTGLVAARVSTRVMRPTFDPDREEERRACSTYEGQLRWRREIDAIPLPAGSSSYLMLADIDAAMDLFPPDAPHEAVGAGADYAHSSDASGLGVAVRYRGGIFGALLVMEIPSSPDQRPSATYKTFARAARNLGVRSIAQDNVHRENVREAYTIEGVSFRDAAPKADLYPAMKAILQERRLALANLPAADRAKLRKQLASIVAVPLPGGGTKIMEPRSSAKDAATGKGTTHCDMLRALATALWEVGAGRPETWAHTEERRAASEATQMRLASIAPRPGSLASLSAYRNGGRVPAGRCW